MSTDITPVPESVLQKMRSWREEQAKEKAWEEDQRRERAFSAIATFAEELPDRTAPKRVYRHVAKGNCPCHRYGTETFLCPHCETVFCPQCENYRHTNCQKGNS